MEEIAETERKPELTRQYKTTEAQRLAKRKYDIKNNEKVKEYHKNYYQKNKEKEKEKYRLKNIEKNTKKLLLLINPNIFI